MAQIFGCRAAAQGGVVRRQVHDVEQILGRERFLREAERRDFQVLENAGHFVVFCNGAPIRRLR